MDKCAKAGENSKRLMKKVGDIVEFHAETKQLSLILIDPISFSIETIEKFRAY